MNAHITAYLMNLSWDAMTAACSLSTRSAQRAAVMDAVQIYPEHNRRFIANCAWSKLGYGGGI